MICSLYFKDLFFFHFLMLEVIKEGVKFFNILLLFFILLTVLVLKKKKVKLPSKK